MVIFFIVLTIFFLIYLLFLILYLSNIEIEINKFWFDSTNINNKKLKDYLFYIRLKLFDKITLLKIKIDNKKIIKMKDSKFLSNKTIKKIFENINIKEFIQKNKKEIFNINRLKELNITIKYFDLNLKLSTSNTVLT